MKLFSPYQNLDGDENTVSTFYTLVTADESYGIDRSGICIFSKWPIVEALFHQWQVNGYMHKIFHGDWFGGKGVGLCRLDINGFQVNVFTAHVTFA